MLIHSLSDSVANEIDARNESRYSLALTGSFAPDQPEAISESTTTARTAGSNMSSQRIPSASAHRSKSVDCASVAPNANFSNRSAALMPGSSSSKQAHNPSQNQTYMLSQPLSASRAQNYRNSAPSATPEEPAVSDNHILTSAPKKRRSKKLHRKQIVSMEFQDTKNAPQLTRLLRLVITIQICQESIL